MNDKFFSELKEKIQPFYESGGSHAFDYTERVYNLALKLSKGLDVDRDVIRAAALLHDVSRLKEDNKEVECHAEHGASKAREILNGMNFPQDKIEKVFHAINVHRWSKQLKAETKEAEILQDADRLDALGAITIARMFSSGGKFEIPIYDSKVPISGENSKGYSSPSTIHSFHAKILKIKPGTFNTEKAKKMAMKRYAFVEKFLKQFKLEWDGKA